MFKKNIYFTIFLALISTTFSTLGYTNSQLEAANSLAVRGTIKDHKNNPKDYNLDSNVLRQEIALISRRVSGFEEHSICQNKFSDVSSTIPNNWICKNIESLAYNNLISRNNTFRPEDFITKTEALIMFIKSINFGFKVKNMSNWQKEVIDFAVSKGIVENFTDYNSLAKRGWIFELTEKSLNIKKMVCTSQYDPVCGVNSKTYKTFGNSCTLNNDFLYNFSYKGECLKVNPTPPISNGPIITDKILFLKTPERDLYMNVVHSNDGVKRPAIIVIHGGGWKIGDEDTNLGFAKELAGQGYFVIAPTYRYSSEKQYPTQVNDVKESYNWLLTNTNKYNIDIENIGVFGASAGAYLSMMLGFDNSLDIKAVVSQFGPTDFTSLEEDANKVGWTSSYIESKSRITNDLLGCDILDPISCPIMKEASPINNYDKQDPPLLLLHGLEDDAVPYEQSIRLRDYGLSIGQDVQLYLEKGLGHDPKVRVNNLANIFNFYDKNLKKIIIEPAPQDPIIIDTKKNNFGHYIFINTSDVSKNIDQIKNNSNILGVQRKYYWKDLEKSKDVYDFSSIRNDLNLLKKYNKQLVLQFQIKSFNNNLVLIPDYLLTSEYGGGTYDVSSPNKNESGRNAVIWNENLKVRYMKILDELAREFDNDINFEAITLNETAISADNRQLLGSNYSEEAYYLAITDIMKGAKNSFKNSSVIQYVNFLPNNNDIPRIHNFAQINDIGIGGPDVYVNRGNLLNTTNSEVSKLPSTMTIGYAIQWHDYTQVDKDTGKKISVNDIYNFAKTTLKSDYYFWLNREPYFTNEVLPIINNN